MSGRDKNALEGKRRVAVALEYTGSGAPRVTAKGSGELAEQIIQLAQQHGIPLETDKQLVEILARLPLEGEIPEQLYRVVAEVIAFAYIIRGKFPAGHPAGESKLGREPKRG